MEALIPFIVAIVCWIVIYKYNFNKRNKSKLLSHILGFAFSFLAFVVTVIVVAPPLTEEQKLNIEKEKKQKELNKIEEQKIEEQKKAEEKKLLELKKLNDELNISLKEAKDTPINSIEKLAENYVLQKNLDKSYNKKFYDCLGNLIWDKDESFTVGKMLDWCYDDYKQSKDHKMKDYYNTAWLLDDFSRWDGSYSPLEKLIKGNMHNDSSYEHVKTVYNLVYYGTKRPYMSVTTTFKGTNVFNAIITQTVNIKVDARTKEIFDIKQ
ncbi:MAG: hypothetical protein AB7U51_04450 [Arcobacter sp.]|uniref:hypothetical protein n=1 Tax=Arcobacter sp. TaxID=1872629 RepID=UPI003CFEB9BA